MQGAKQGSVRQASDLLHHGLRVGDVSKGKNREAGVPHRLVTSL